MGLSSTVLTRPYLPVPKTAMNPLLEIRDLTVCYHDGTRALRGVDLSLGPAERVALIGPNGAGKTTLLLAVMRGVPFGGGITVEGLESSRRNAEAIRARCGMVFQQPDDQLFMPTLLEDVAFGPLNQGLSPAEAEERARQAIAAVGLGGRESRGGHHLSGGEKRAAALATVLAMQVKLLLLDEPGADLDLRSRRRLTGLLAGRPEAMLLATHDLDMAGRLCSRAVVMEAGEAVADGPIADILADRALLAAHGLA